MSKKPVKSGAAVSKKSSFLPYLILAGSVLLTLIVRLRLLGIPMERDEGEFAYVAQLILHGNSPYAAYYYKLPGVSYMYALSMALFGNSLNGIRIGLLLVNLGCIVLLFAILRKKFSPYTAAIACAVFSLLSIDRAVAGNSAHATHYVNLFVLAGVLLFQKAAETKKLLFYFLTGLSIGFAFIMKQPALVFFGIPVVLIAFQAWKNKSGLPAAVKEMLTVFAGGAMPYLILILVILGFHDFPSFWKWSVVYPEAFTNTYRMQNLSINLGVMLPFITSYNLLLWICSLLGFVLIFFSTKLSTEQKIVAIVFFLTAVASVVPGFSFRNHYFIAVIPAASLLVALGLDVLKEGIEKVNTKLAPWGVLLVFVFLAGKSVAKQKEYLFKKSPVELCRMIYGSNPFIESQQIGKFILANTTDSDKVAVLGSEAEIYFYSRRRAATGFMDMYEMGKDQKYNQIMQKDMIAEIEKNRPKIIVFVKVFLSWSFEPNAPQDIFKWFDPYTKEHYNIGASVEMLPTGTDYKWGADAQHFQPTSDKWILVFTRKD